jgi:hypothetical protein
MHVYSLDMRIAELEFIMDSSLSGYFGVMMRRRMTGAHIYVTRPVNPRGLSGGYSLFVAFILRHFTPILPAYTCNVHSWNCFYPFRWHRHRSMGVYSQTVVVPDSRPLLDRPVLAWGLFTIATSFSRYT